MHTTQNAVARAIKVQRIRSGIASDTELARLAGMSQSALSKRLSGDIRMSLLDVEILADALGVNPFELMDLARTETPTAA